MKKTAKKKQRSLLFRDKEVVASKKKLKTLKFKKKELKESIKNIVEMYNSTIANITSTGYENFPLETIDDLVRFKDGNKDDFKLPMMAMRNDLKKKYVEATQELEFLYKEIDMAEIEALLAKTKCIEKKV